jgi:hypothetical protein
MERAISSHMEVALLPPVSDLTFPTAKGDTGLLVYRSGFVFRVGPSCYAISRHSAGLAAALAVAFLVALVILTQLWKKVKLGDAQQERCRQRR